MGWRGLLLLLHLHLVACVYLPSPSNVTIYSLNLEHSLSFTPGPGTPAGARFAVEVLRHRRNSWRPVSGCSALTARQTCNLTRVFRDSFDHYQARVRATAPDQTSNWTKTGLFQPLTDTVLGPPGVSVSGCGNCLLLRLSVPTTRGIDTLKGFYRELVVHVRRTRDDAQFRLSLQYQEEAVITYLQPGVEYCVTVSVEMLFNSNSVPSEAHCAFTSPPPADSLHVVYGLLGAFCAVGLLLTGFAVCRSRRRLKSRLSTALITDPPASAGTPGNQHQYSAEGPELETVQI